MAHYNAANMLRPLEAYNSLVRPHVEYASAAWNPFEKPHKKALEVVQRCAVRFVCSDYSKFSSVTSMQHSLVWDTLEVHRYLSAATMMYKAVHFQRLSPWPIEAIAPTTLIKGSVRVNSSKPHGLKSSESTWSEIATNSIRFLYFRQQWSQQHETLKAPTEDLLKFRQATPHLTWQGLS